MYKTSMMTIVTVLLIAPPLALAADKCPTELSQAKAMLNKAGAATKSVGPPRELAGARSQDVQAPRTPSQDVQAPRTASQDVQAPRTPSQDVQAPRTPSQDVQAPRTPSRSQGEQSSRVSNAQQLIKDAEAACKTGDMTTASAKAKEAMALLK